MVKITKTVKLQTPLALFASSHCTTFAFSYAYNLAISAVERAEKPDGLIENSSLLATTMSTT